MDLPGKLAPLVLKTKILIAALELLMLCLQMRKLLLWRLALIHRLKLAGPFISRLARDTRCLTDPLDIRVRRKTLGLKELAGLDHNGYLLLCPFLVHDHHQRF